MDGTFVTSLAGQLLKPEPHTVNGRDVLALPPGWKAEAVAEHGAPPPLEFETLAGLAEYVNKGPDAEAIEGAMLHVVGHDDVRLVTPLTPAETLHRRSTFAVAKPMQVPHHFGKWAPPETFVIWLQSSFEATPERDDLIKFCSSVTGSATRTVVDDGVSQEVSARRGASMVQNAKVPNPVALRPFVSFPDVQQPEVKYVLRARGGSEDELPQFALFEADRMWPLAAHAAIVGKLIALCPDFTVVG